VLVEPLVESLFGNQTIVGSPWTIRLIFGTVPLLLWHRTFWLLPALPVVQTRNTWTYSCDYGRLTQHVNHRPRFLPRWKSLPAIAGGTSGSERCVGSHPPCSCWVLPLPTSALVSYHKGHVLHNGQAAFFPVRVPSPARTSIKRSHHADLRFPKLYLL